jgi:hypothetical protein
MTIEKRIGQASEGLEPLGGGKNAPQPAESQTTHELPYTIDEAPDAAIGRNPVIDGIEQLIPSLDPGKEWPFRRSGPCSGWDYTPEGDFLGYEGIIDDNGRFAGRA